jgi:HK97 gp10 family phage protein
VREISPEKIQNKIKQAIILTLNKVGNDIVQTAVSGAPVRTGTLAHNIKMQLTENSVKIGVPVYQNMEPINGGEIGLYEDYPLYHETGTMNRKKSAYLAKGFHKHRNQIPEEMAQNVRKAIVSSLKSR